MSQTLEPLLITRDLYRAVSGQAGRRDWTLAERHFHPDARLVRTGMDEDGRPFQDVMTWASYKVHADSRLANVSFWEEEVAQRSFQFAATAQIRSLYAYRVVDERQTLSGRGLNLFNLVMFEEGWKIMSMIWANERPGLTLDGLSDWPQRRLAGNEEAR